MTDIVLVRHAETDWSGLRYCGRTDVELNAVGIAASDEIGKRLRRMVVAPARLISSPQRRALQTAVAIGRAFGWPDPSLDARWSEADMGDADGLTFDDISARWPKLAVLLARGDDDVAWPRGEARGALTARVSSALAELAGQAGPTIVVTHGGPIRVALRITSTPADGYSLPPGAAVRVEGARALSLGQVHEVDRLRARLPRPAQSFETMDG